MRRNSSGTVSVVFLALVSLVLGVIALRVINTYQASANTPQPQVAMEVLDPSLEQYAVAWQAEIGRRFTNAVGVLAHGGDLEEGRWVIKSDHKRLETADGVVAHYQKLYPGRTIVLLSCNPGHLKLNIPGVYHFHSSVWCVPDRAVGNDPIADVAKLGTSRWQGDPEVEGNIFEASAD